MFSRVLLALDGSDGSARALPFLSDLGVRGDTHVDVVFANEHLVGRAHGPVNPAVEDEIDQIQAVTNDLREDGWDAELHVIVCMAGGAAPELAQFATSHGCDVIVTGTRGHSPWAGALVGSVTQRLLHLAPCPVFVVPAASDHAEPEGSPTAAAQSA